MNQTVCKDGFATDEIFFYENAPLTCDMAIWAWIFIGVVVTLIKLVVAIGHSYLWMKREASRQARKPKVTASSNRAIPRLPIVPTISWAMVVNFTLFFTLTGLNIANPINGLAAFWYGLAWLGYGISNLLFLLKFVSLGHRIVPQTRKWAATLNSNRKLSKLDLKETISLALSVLALIGQTLSLCIVSWIYPGHYTVIQTAVGFQGCFLVLLMFTLINHFRRIQAA